MDPDAKPTVPDKPGIEESEAYRAVRERLVGGVQPSVYAGRYELLGRIGSGAMGVIHRARDHELARDVAIKLVRGRIGADPAWQEALVAEARALARLSHPNVVAVLDVGSTDRDVHVVMELVAGRNLRQWLRESARGTTAVLDVLVAAGRGLEAAHEAAIVHRDFKPDNILVGNDGRVLVADFGLARSYEGGRTADAEAEAEQAGTPQYMAPEQFDGTAGPNSDQYAYCVTAIEALTGEHVFAGETPTTLRAEKLRASLVRPAALPRGLWRVLRRGLAVDPRSRWPSMRELLQALVDARRRPRWTPMIAASFGIVVTSALLLAQPRASECADASQRLAAVWSPGRSEGIRAAFAASGSARAEQAWRVLDDRMASFAREWTESHAQTCAIVGGDEHACSLRRLGRVDALLGVFEQATARDVTRTATVLHETLRRRPCDTHELELDAASDDPELAEMLLDFDRLSVLQNAARFADVRRLADDLVARARARGDEELVARARWNLGTLAMNEGRFDAARQDYEAAYYALEHAGDGLLAVQSALGVANVETRQRRIAAAEQWLRHARALAEARSVIDAEPAVLHAEAALDTIAGRLAEAEDRYRSEVVQRERIGDESGACTARHELAAVILEQGRLDDAELELNAVLACWRELSGDDHPDTAATLGNLGVVALQRGRWDDALAMNDRALALQADRDDAPIRPLGNTWVNRGLALMNMGRYDAALESMQRGVDILRAGASSEEQKVDLGRAEVNLGAAFGRAGQLERSLHAYERGFEALRSVLPADHPLVAAATLNVAEAFGLLGRDDEAVRWGESALAAVESSFGAKHIAMAMARANLGRVESRRGHHDRAIELLEAALASEAAATDPALVIDASTDLALLLAARRESARPFALVTRARTLLPQIAAEEERRRRATALDHAARASCKGTGPRPDACRHE